MNTPVTPAIDINTPSGQKFEHPASASRSMPNVSLPVSAAAGMRGMHFPRMDCSAINNRQISDDLNGGADYANLADPAHPQDEGYSMERQRVWLDQSASIGLDRNSAARASYYGRRLYPSFDPSHAHACPMRFVRQFEHAALHNGLPLHAWAKRFDSCLHGQAEDWAFEECPLDMSGTPWDIRRRQFLDWALLPAEQELRRQRLLKFYQTEADLSIDFVYSFEEAARGLRDYKEHVWVRKCIANLLPPLRGTLFQLCPDSLPVRFRDLRDLLYAADWNLYEAASTPLKVVKCWEPYAYETYNYPIHQNYCTDSRGSLSIDDRSQALRQSILAAPYIASTAATTSGTSICHSPPLLPASAPASAPPQPPPLPTSISTTALSKRRHGTPKALGVSHKHSNANSATVLSPSKSTADSADMASKIASTVTTASPAYAAATSPAGVSELVSTLSRMSDKERSVIMVALEKMSMLEDPSVSQDGSATLGIKPKSSSRLGRVSSLANKALGASSHSSTSRAAAAAVIAATAQIACMESNKRYSANSSTDGSTGSSTGTASGIRNVPQRNSSISIGLLSDSDDKVAPVSGRRSSKSIKSPIAGAFGSRGAGKICLRKRPKTSAANSRRQSSPLLGHSYSIKNKISVESSGFEHDSEAHRIVANAYSASASNNMGNNTSSVAHTAATAAAAMASTHRPAGTRKPGHVRKLANRRSDSVLTTAARSMTFGDDTPFRESADDNPIQSPEFTILHPTDTDQMPHARRGRFAFIKKISNILSHKDVS
ncbi:hypothetical protein GGI12_001266 [Dipsacomyces acuminosporus]|nr:hypothetical protein GGI12_001266 [Dipsacomyces acuminosporus]